MSSITIYTNPGCGQCITTFRALDKANVTYATLGLSPDAAAVDRVRELGYSQASVVITDTDHWSGFRPDKISAIDRSC